MRAEERAIFGRMVGIGLALVLLQVGVSRVEGITFAARPGVVFVPARLASERLGWPFSYDPVFELIEVKGRKLDVNSPRLSDGTWLVPVATLAEWGATVRRELVRSEGKEFRVSVGAKRVSVDLAGQRLKAFQGATLVYDAPVSTGRDGHNTPDGRFRSGRKERMHISTIYGSEMPWSVHVTGNIFIHGSQLFSDAPGSHGCIRLPLSGNSLTAQEFYDWIDVGTPVTISGRYSR